MHVGYFSSHLGTQGGPVIVDKRVLEAISKYDHRNSYTVYGITRKSTEGLATDPLADNIRIKTIRPAGKWPAMAVGLPLELTRHPVDLLHVTLFPPLVVPCKYVFTVTCWSPYLQPEFYPLTRRLRVQLFMNLAIRKASAILCYTRFLKNMVVERFRIDPERVLLLQPGVGEEMKPVENTEHVTSFLKRFGIEGPYILFVGALTQRKNVEGLVRAYDILRNEYKIDHKLVLLGEHIFLSKAIFKAIKELGLTDRIVLVPRQRHSDLRFFYSGASVFVFPTFSEGFGLPPLEAMACGAPVVASNVTSVPEVVGDAAILFNPYDYDDMAAAIAKCLTNPELRNELIGRGKNRAAEFTWERAARQAVTAYETTVEAGW